MEPRLPQSHRHSDRLIPFKRSPWILVLDDGRLLGDGRHDDLLRTVPLYAALWEDYTRAVVRSADRAIEPAT
ncbi:ABC transporter ATP-binding protein [Methylobacterium sp. WL18]|nr:ABC transporter ATP-binding protein [Methylobacterium sp. WL18]